MLSSCVAQERDGGIYGLAGVVMVLVVGCVVGCGGCGGEPRSPASVGDAGASQSQDAGQVDPTMPPGDANGHPGDAAQTQSAADRIRARVASCTQISNGLFATDDETQPEIPFCDMGDAVFWNADMDIDCDGVSTALCNETTDPDFLPDTTAHTSNGMPLDAAELPYVVVPQASDEFDFRAAGLDLGTVVLVVHGDKIDFGIIGDTGPAHIIGEASYAMAKRLGINPNPSNGGTGKGVIYVAFKGKASIVKKNESHDEAVTLGKARALKLFGAP